MKKRWSVGSWETVTAVLIWDGKAHRAARPQKVWVEESRHWTRYGANLRVEGWRQAGSYWHQVRDLKEEK